MEIKIYQSLRKSIKASMNKETLARLEVKMEIKIYQSLRKSIKASMNKETLARFFPGKAKSLRWNLKVHFLCKNNTTLNSVVFAASHIPITRTEQVLRIPPEKIKFMTQQSMQKYTQIFLVDTDASLNLYPSPKYCLFGNF